MTVQPYHFQLKKLSSKQLQLEQVLFSLFGQQDVGATLQKSIEQHAQVHAHFQLESWQSETGTEALSKFADTSVTLVVLLPNRKTPFFLECDVSSARQLIDHALGGRETNEVSGTALTDIEQGVLQYLSLQLLADLGEAAPQEKTFQLQRLLTHGRDVVSLLRDDETFLALTFRMHERGLNHFVRCLFPHSLLNEEFAQRKTPGVSAVTQAAQLQAYPFVRTELWAEAGDVTVAFDDLKALEPGDVLLFDQTRVGFVAGKPQGEVCVRVGNGNVAALLGKLEDNDPAWLRVRLEQQVGEEV